MIIGQVAHCATTVPDLLSGAHAVGTAIVLRDVIVDDMWQRDVLIWYFPPCPPGYFCGQGATTGVISFTDEPMPALGDVIDVWGDTKAGGLIAAGWHKTG